MITQPVLYLDVDDTLINWATLQAAPARGVREFLPWALERFEVRWLTRRCPSGEMPEEMARELCGLIEIEPALVGPVSGLNGETCESKT